MNHDGRWIRKPAHDTEHSGPRNITKHSNTISLSANSYDKQYERLVGNLNGVFIVLTSNHECF